MLLGIDVGGTFTDAVLIKENKIFAMAKAPTTHEEILRGILNALDKVMEGNEGGEIRRVVISSTIVTNALTENKIDPVFLAVMTGPGMSTKGLFPIEPYLAKGYVDHRGKVTTTEEVDYEIVKKMAQGKAMAAVSGKFAVRNQENEKALQRDLKEFNFKKIFAGSEISGELNFVRRTNSAYFSAAVYNEYNNFIKQIKTSMEERNVRSTIYILKADGGTLPLEASLEEPVEAVFTGPAASVLGIEAINAPNVKAISIDVGGTTTDIAFWDKGTPLMAKKGGKIMGYNTSVRTFHMRSIGIGGDSVVRKNGKEIFVGPERAGVAVALGGNKVTLSDALITADRATFGDKNKARNAIKNLCNEQEDISEVAEKIVQVAVESIYETIQDMLCEWSIQPVYTVDDILQGNTFIPELLIGVGGGAPGFIDALGEKMNLPAKVPQGAMVANAIGAALSKPTLSATLRADTTEGYYLIPEGQIKEKIKGSFNREKAEEILAAWLFKQAKKWEVDVKETEVVAYEEFPTIHDYYSSGKIIYMKLQLKPGILCTVKAKEVAF